MKQGSLSMSLLFVFVILGGILAAPAQERHMGGVGITIFADRNFRGKSATFQQDVPNLDGLGFNDKVSSLRVGRGERWEVCEHANYQGRCVVVSGEESDLKRNGWNDLISSFRRVNGGIVPPRPEPPSGNWYIVLFDQPTYRGNPINLNVETSDLGNLGRRTQSVTIGRGVWQFCEGRNYTGRCVTLDRSVPDLRAYNLNHRIGSVRPVGAGGPTHPPEGTDWYIVLFDQPNYRGNPTNYNSEMSSINKRSGSVTIGRGVWELCEGRNFTGRCVRLDKSVSDLRGFGLPDRVSSVRPLIRQPR